VALCLRPHGLAIAPEIEAALRDAAARLAAAGYTVEEIADTPSLIEASELQLRLWLGDGFAAFADSVEREADPGALAVLAAVRPHAEALPADVVPQTLIRRAALTRAWLLFLERHPVLLLPVSAELPFADDLDMQSPAAFDRVWRAQLVQTGLPLMGLPGLTVSTGMAGTAPVGVQLIAGRYREDLLLAAGEAIEAGGVPPAPIDPVTSRP
jgi:amidase